MLGRAGVATGMDLGKLVESSQWLGQIMNRKLPGMVAQAPLFPKVG
jgi:hydroxymethylglutaryl-CoA lyase